jgi:hypothetical protein
VQEVAGPPALAVVAEAMPMREVAVVLKTSASFLLRQLNAREIVVSSVLLGSLQPFVASPLTVQLALSWNAVRTPWLPQLKLYLQKALRPELPWNTIRIPRLPQLQLCLQKGLRLVRPSTLAKSLARSMV